MADLRKRFGELLAAHRRRRGMTQEDLAEAAGLSVDMISKIEVGATGARFPSIERLAKAGQVDPAELFTRLSSRPLKKAHNITRRQWPGTFKFSPKLYQVTVPGLAEFLRLYSN
jgi:transcriptional regulator with XRE-family HTH domain